MLLQETHFRFKGTQRLKMRRQKKKTRVAILISDKIDFNIKTVTRDKEGYYVMIKRSI